MFLFGQKALALLHKVEVKPLESHGLL